MFRASLPVQFFCRFAKGDWCNGQLRPWALESSLFDAATSPLTPESIKDMDTVLQSNDLAAQAPLIVGVSRRPGVKVGRCRLTL